MLQNDVYAWYAVYTKSRHEKRVAERLRDKGIEVYLPLIVKLNQWRDRKKEVEEPLLKGYVFVRIDNKLRMQVLQTDGIVYFVKIGNDIPVIPDWQIEAMKIFIREYGEKIEMASYQKFKIGQKVVVTEGAMKGLKGSVIQQGKKVRFAVGIDSVKASFSVEINPEFLEPLDEPPDESKGILAQRPLI
jgi:transcription antitermination factor NusG